MRGKVPFVAWPIAKHRKEMVGIGVGSALTVRYKWGEREDGGKEDRGDQGSPVGLRRCHRTRYPIHKPKADADHGDCAAENENEIAPSLTAVLRHSHRSKSIEPGIVGFRELDLPLDPLPSQAADLNGIEG